MPKTAPVLNEMARKLIDQAIREGKPFTVKDLYTREFAELAEKCAPNPEDRYGKPVIEYVNLVLNFALRREKYRNKLWKRVSRASGKIEREGMSHVLYPSNDRDRFHLKDYEVFMPHHIRPSDKEWRAYTEFPVRHAEVTPPAEEAHPDVDLMADQTPYTIESVPFMPPTMPQPEPCVQPELDLETMLALTMAIASTAWTLRDLAESMGQTALSLNRLLEAKGK